MSFWQSLGTYVTRTAMPLKRLQLQGRLQDQLSPQNRQGPARISAVSYSDAVHIWDMNQYLSTVPLADQRARDDMNVYWLPWKQHEVTTVMMHDLNLSGCNYFLTSEFSGCRFNIADDRLQHVAWGAGPRRDGTSIDRNYALLASWQATTMPTRVRTYSYSKLPNPDANGSLVQDGYGAMDIHGNMSPNARALVIGWKISNEWRFYMQQWVAGSDLAIFRRIEA